MSPKLSPQPSSKSAGYLFCLVVLAIAAAGIALPLAVIQAPTLSPGVKAVSLAAIALLYIVLFQRFVISDMRDQLRSARSMTAFWKDDAAEKERHIHWLSRSLSKRNHQIMVAKTRSRTSEGE